MDKAPHVYILASDSGVLYTGMTSNLPHRLYQHKQKKIPGFTKKYNVTKLVWVEQQSSADSARSREKQIKAWTRAKKVALIQAANPQWKDLSAVLR